MDFRLLALGNTGFQMFNASSSSSDDTPPDDGKNVPFWALGVVSLATLLLLILIGVVIHRVFKTEPVILALPGGPNPVVVEQGEGDERPTSTEYYPMGMDEKAKRDAMISMQEHS
jgi:hypothetical protein